MAALVTANQFGSLVPQISLAGQGFAQGQQIGQNIQAGRLRRKQGQQDRQLGQFSQQALTGDSTALSDVAAIDPKKASQIQAFLASQDEAARAEGLRENEVLTRGALDALSIEDPVRRRAFISQKADLWESQGRDVSRTRKALEADDGQLTQELTMQARNGLAITELAKQQLGEGQKLGRPMAAVNTAGDSVFIERGPSGQLREIEGFAPPAKSGEIIESTPGGGFRITRGTTTPGQGLSRKVVADLEDKLISNEENLSSLDRIGDQYMPDFLTYKGRIGSSLTSFKSKLGADISPEDKAFLKSRRKFTQNINQFFNKYRKEITGAAASIQELASLKKAMFNEDNSPAEFEAGFTEFKSEMQRANRLQRKILRDGIRETAGKDLDDLFTSGLDDDIESRGAELREKGASDEDILKILEKEGYTGQVQ